MKRAERRPCSGRSCLLRRACSLVAFWEKNDFVIENYLTGKQTRVSPLVAHILREMDTYEPRHVVLGRLASISGTDELLDKLIAQDVVVRKGSPLDTRDQLLDRIWVWGHDARFYHHSSRRVLYEEDMEVQQARLAAHAHESPPPSPFKEYEGQSWRLPGRFQDRRGDFWEVLQARRTRRRFSGKPLSLSDFSTLLLWTWGCTRIVEHQTLGPYVLKVSPSGGARHAIEVYPVVLRVEGVQPGIYHYSVKRHALNLVRRGNFQDLVVHLCSNQTWVRDAAAVFFMTAVVSRVMWKYTQSFAYRVLNLDAGHLGQTFHLVCTKLGLAPFTTAATRNEALERVLGLNGISEIAMYAAVVGRP